MNIAFGGVFTPISRAFQIQPFLQQNNVIQDHNEPFKSTWRIVEMWFYAVQFDSISQYKGVNVEFRIWIGSQGCLHSLVFKGEGDGPGRAWQTKFYSTSAGSFVCIFPNFEMYLSQIAKSFQGGRSRQNLRQQLSFIQVCRKLLYEENYLGLKFIDSVRQNFFKQLQTCVKVAKQQFL